MLYTSQSAGMVLFALAAALFLLPWLIGLSRGVLHPHLLFWGNLLFAGTVLGWFVALVYGCAGETRLPHAPASRRGGRIDPPPMRR